jgi:hypothetical protein
VILISMIVHPPTIIVYIGSNYARNMIHAHVCTTRFGCFFLLSVGTSQTLKWVLLH